jgi:hypothetical protein
MWNRRERSLSSRVLIAIVATTVAFLCFRPLAAPFSSDETFYLRMSTGLFDVPPEYRYRVLSPFLVALSGMGLYGFWLLAIICLAGSYVAFEAYLRAMSFTADEALVGVATMATLFFTTINGLGYPILPDQLMLLLIVAALLAAVSERWFLFASILALGVANKENIVYVVPAVIFLRAEREGLALAAFRTALLCVPAAATIAVIHMMLRGTLGPSYIFSTLFLNFHLPDVRRTWVRGLLMSGLVGFSPWILAGLQASPSSQKRLLFGSIVGLLPILAVAHDIDRELSLLAPFWIPIFVSSGRRLSLRPPTLVAIACASNLTMDAAMLHLGNVSLTVSDSLRLIAISVSWLPFAITVLLRRQDAAARIAGRSSVGAV